MGRFLVFSLFLVKNVCFDVLLRIRYAKTLFLAKNAKCVGFAVFAPRVLKNAILGLIKAGVRRLFSELQHLFKQYFCASFAKQPSPILNYINNFKTVYVQKNTFCEKMLFKEAHL